jgi:hypothetical protein
MLLQFHGIGQRHVMMLVALPKHSRLLVMCPSRTQSGAVLVVCTAQAAVVYDQSVLVVCTAQAAVVYDQPAGGVSLTLTAGTPCLVYHRQLRAAETTTAAGNASPPRVLMSQLILDPQCLEVTDPETGVRE